MSYTYDLAGHVLSETYPSGHVVSNSFDAAGRLSSVTGTLGDGTSRSYSSGIIYSALGGMTNEQFGTDTPIYNKLQYNVRGQLWDTRVGTALSGNQDWNRGALQFFYDQSYSYGGSGTDNNGNVLAAKHYRPLDDGSSTYTISTDQYSYDTLNRITSVSENYESNTQSATQQFQQSYTYDRYGNRTINQGGTWGAGINNKQFTPSQTNNRLGVPSGQTGTMTYDNAGNLTNDTYSGQGQRNYDAENRMTQAWANSQWQTYTYDANGQRVKRSININGTQTETWQVYGVNGELLAEYAANASASSPQKEYGYRNGQLLVEIMAAGGSGWGSPPTFTDNPLAAGVTEVKALHITQLRTAINDLRGHLNKGVYPWQYSATTNDWISANPILEMRTALDDALGVPTPAYSAGLAQGQPIKAIHIQELRDRVTAAWGSGSGGVDIRWLVADQLGTPRIILDKTGALANVKRHDYLPFGEELFAGQGGRTTLQGYVADGIRQQFTSKERDNETGLDYFLARYYSSTQGRFTSVDPSRRSIIGANPQTWNRYSYTYNNPLVLVDDNGKWPKGIHDELIRKAFPGLTRREISQIQSGSASVDVKRGFPITLIESQAYKHSMTPGSYVREMGSVPAAQAKAMAEAATFVATKTAEATQYQLAGQSSKALFAIGEASHPVTDNTSPAHAGFQVYSIPQTVVMIPGLGLPAVVPDADRFARDLQDHTAREAGPITSEQEKAAINGLRAVYASALGEEALQRAITEPPPPPQPMPHPTPQRRY